MFLKNNPAFFFLKIQFTKTFDTRQWDHCFTPPWLRRNLRIHQPTFPRMALRNRIVSRWKNTIGIPIIFLRYISLISVNDGVGTSFNLNEESLERIFFKPHESNIWEMALNERAGNSSWDSMPPLIFDQEIELNVRLISFDHFNYISMRPLWH